MVEAKREDWTLDPFNFTEKDGFFYGRGTGDDKAQAAVWIATLIRFKREGFKPDRDIIVALTADEEGGGPYNGVDWLLKNHRDLIDAEFALNEGGWGEDVARQEDLQRLQVSEKYVINFRFEVRNKGGHSSMPVPDNAIYHLAGALDRLANFGFPLKTNEVTAAYFTQMAKIETGPIKADLAKVAAGSQAAMQRVAAASSHLERHAAHHLRRHHARRRPRPQRAARNSPPPRSTAACCPRIRRVRLDTLKKVVADDQVAITSIRARHQRRALAHAPRFLKAVRPRYRNGVARRPRRSHHGHGRHRRPLSPHRRHPHLRRPGLLHGPRRHPLPRPRRAYGPMASLPVRTAAGVLSEVSAN